jgi:hypothetical protein
VNVEAPVTIEVELRCSNPSCSFTWWGEATQHMGATDVSDDDFVCELCEADEPEIVGQA